MLFIVKMVTDLTAFDMGYKEELIVACKTIKSAIAEAEKVIERELDNRKSDSDDDGSLRATKEEFIKWSNAINGGFIFYLDSMGESLSIEIVEVEYVD